MFPVRHKFKAVPTWEDSIRFPSKLEAACYRKILLMQKAGEVVFFLRQVPFHLPGGTKHLVDFVTFNTDGSVHFLEAKGYDTPIGKMKRKIIEATYPIKIEILK